MDQIKRIGLFAAIFVAAVAQACTTTVTKNDGSGGSGGSGGGGPSCPSLPVGGSCPVEGQVCSDLNECGWGLEATCQGGMWQVLAHDPGPGACGCGIPCGTCPDEQPVDGSACGENEATCSYTDPSCKDAGANAICSGGVWMVSQYGPGCIPTCPATLPVAGTPCNGCCLSSTCDYLDESGCPAHITCENEVWVVSPSACMPGSACATKDMTQCLNAQGCRWMAHAACADSPQSFPQGCYPVGDCASNADCNGGTCAAVEVDPCPAGDCNACKAQAHICLP